MRSLTSLAAVAATMLGGCSTIVGGVNQTVSVETYHVGPLAGAQCKLVNDKGTWFVTSPGSTMVHRSLEDLHVTCAKDSLPAGTMQVKSNTKPLLVGNALFGGVIGVGVDIASGAAFDYPTMITVLMGQTGRLEAPAGQPAPAGSTPTAAPVPVGGRSGGCCDAPSTAPSTAPRTGSQWGTF